MMGSIVTFQIWPKSKEGSLLKYDTILLEARSLPQYSMSATLPHISRYEAGRTVYALLMRHRWLLHIVFLKMWPVATEVEKLFVSD
jgi:hypothetical protein